MALTTAVWPFASLWVDTIVLASSATRRPDCPPQLPPVRCSVPLLRTALPPVRFLQPLITIGFKTLRLLRFTLPKIPSGQISLHPRLYHSP